MADFFSRGVEKTKGKMMMQYWRLLCFFTLVILIERAELIQGLKKDFYQATCPGVENIVSQVVSSKARETFVTIPATLRLFFHDCFIEGCDASIMIFSPNGDAEKDADDNLSLAGDGFDTIIRAKEAVEAVCPGVVSCADILALAARDVVVLAGGPSFNVELGRRDGLVSQASRVEGSLPLPEFNLSQLTTIFARHNLSQTDMIALSGAHTIGASHCDRFSKRLYSFSQKNSMDPSLDPIYAQQLMLQCPPKPDPNIVVFMDPATPFVFDNTYYQDLVSRKGLFTSDQVLFTDPKSKQLVSEFANNPGSFHTAFVRAMKKLGRVGVKTGKQGEIRRDCATFNT